LLDRLAEQQLSGQLRTARNNDQLLFNISSSATIVMAIKVSRLLCRQRVSQTAIFESLILGNRFDANTFTSQPATNFSPSERFQLGINVG